MQLSVSLEMILPGTDFLDKVSRVAESGFDAVEFWGWKDKDIEGLRRRCSDHGVTVSNFSGHRSHSLIFKEESEAYIREVEESMEVAAALGCSNLMLLSNALGEGGAVLDPGSRVPEDEKWAAARETLKRLAGRAEKRGIVLHLEPLNTLLDHSGNFLCRSDQAFSLIREVDRPNVRVLYDIYHMQIMEGNVISTLTANRDLVGYVHFADVPGRHEPGTGEINLGNILKALRSSGYHGFVGLEFSPSKDWPSSARAIKACVPKN